MTVTINGSTGISGVDGSAGTPALQGGDTNTGIVFGTDTVGVSTGGVQRTTVDSNGRLLVGVGSANANGGVLQLSGGITFPGTAVAATDVNTLDDYEEGNWTPIWNVTTGSITANSNTSGRYTKIGRTVFIWGYISYQSNSGASGDVSVGGLPFTAGSAFGQSNNRSGGAHTIGNAFFASNSPNFANILAGGTSLYPLMSTATAFTSLTFADFSLASNYDQFVFTGQYNI